MERRGCPPSAAALYLELSKRARGCGTVLLRGGEGRARGRGAQQAPGPGSWGPAAARSGTSAPARSGGAARPAVRRPGPAPPRPGGRCPRRKNFADKSSGGSLRGGGSGSAAAAAPPPSPREGELRSAPLRSARLHQAAPAAPGGSGGPVPRRRPAGQHGRLRPRAPGAALPGALRPARRLLAAAARGEPRPGQRPVHRDPARHDGPRRGGRGDGLLLPGQRLPLLLARDPVVVRAQPQGLDGQTDVGFRPAKSIAAGRRWEGRDKNKCGEGGRQQHLAQAAPVAGEAHGRGHLRVPGDRLQRRQGPAPQGQGLPAGGPGAERRAAPPRPRLGPAAGHAAAGRPAGRARGPPAPPPQGRQGAQEALGGRLVPAVD